MQERERESNSVSLRLSLSLYLPGRRFTFVLAPPRARPTRLAGESVGIGLGETAIPRWPESKGKNTALMNYGMYSSCIVHIHTYILSGSTPANPPTERERGDAPLPFLRERKYCSLRYERRAARVHRLHR